MRYGLLRYSQSFSRLLPSVLELYVALPYDQVYHRLAYTLLKLSLIHICFVAAVIILDFATGLIKAKITGEGWESRKGTKGFWKKVALFAGLFFGIFLDYFIPTMLQFGINYTLPFDMPVGMIIGVYIILNECISICENLYTCNPKIIPAWVAKLLKIAVDKVETAGEEKTEEK